MEFYNLERDLLASIIRWGNNELKNEVQHVNPDDFIEPVYRDIFIGMKESDFITSIYISKVVSEYGENERFERFIKNLEDEAIHRGCFLDVLSALREKNSQKRLHTKLSSALLVQHYN